MEKVIQSRRKRFAANLVRMGEVRNACNILAGKPKGKRPLGRPRRGWEDSVTVDLREIV
jgi:hypothetical protein